jgi:hypothetical protein
VVTYTRVDGEEVSGARRSERSGRWRGDEDGVETLTGGGGARPGGDGVGFGQRRRAASGSGGVRLRTAAVTQR